MAKVATMAPEAPMAPETTRPALPQDFSPPRMVQFEKINQSQGPFSFNGYPGMNGRPIRHPDTKANRHNELESPEWGIMNFFENIYEEDAALLKWVRESPYCEGSALQKLMGVPPVFREIDIEREAKTETDNTQSWLDALNAINALPLAQRNELAFSIGCTAPGNSDTVRLQALQKYATADPAGLLARIGNINGDTKVLAAMEWALEGNKCKLSFSDTTKLYYHGAAILGSSKDRAMAAIKETPELLRYLLAEFKASAISK